MYSGELNVSNDNVFTFLAASGQFKISLMENICANHICQQVHTKNVCAYMDEAINFESSVLREKCLEIFSENTYGVLYGNQKEFCRMSQCALSAFLDVERTNILEMDLFCYVKKWMEAKCEDEGLPVNGTNMRKVIGDALYKIRFPTMTVRDFANGVVKIKGLLTHTEISLIFQKIAVFDSSDVECPFPSKYRCQISAFYTGHDDMKELSEAEIIRKSYFDNKKCSFRSLLNLAKDLPDGHRMFQSSFGILLQCCADLANSSIYSYWTNAENKRTREEACDQFHAWKETMETKNVSEIMTQFMELRQSVDKLYNWHKESQ
jgi:hypothetical protein